MPEIEREALAFGSERLQLRREHRIFQPKSPSILLILFILSPDCPHPTRGFEHRQLGQDGQDKQDAGDLARGIV
jgi:hypothetical protein